MEKSRKKILKEGYVIRYNYGLFVIPILVWVGYFFVFESLREEVFLILVICRTGAIVYTIYFILNCIFSKTIIGKDHITLINFLNIMKSIPIRLITGAEINKRLFSKSEDSVHLMVYSGHEKIFSINEFHPEYEMVISTLKNIGIKVIDLS